MLEECTIKVNMEEGIAVIKSRRANLSDYVEGYRKGLIERGCKITGEKGNERFYCFRFSCNENKDKTKF